MLLCQLSSVVQPGIGHCSTRYVSPRVFASLSSGTNCSSKSSEVLVHAVLLVAADEPADGVDAQEHRRVERPQHEVVLLLPDRRIVVQHVVEVADLGNADPVDVERRAHALRALLVERLAQVERVGHRIEHRLGRHVRFRRVQRRRELDVARAQFLRERHPFLNRAVRIRVANFARRQFLERRRQDAHLHELRLERFGAHMECRVLLT